MAGKKLGRPKGSKNVKPKKDPLKEYKKSKIKFLDDFTVHVDLSAFENCMTEHEVDARVKQLITKKLGA